MAIHEDVLSRLKFMNIGEREQTALAGIQPTIASLIGGALDRFYANARATSETRAFFRDDEHMKRAKLAQEVHWLKIASGNFDDDFHSSVRRIGAVHARIGLEPRWYVGGYALVLEELMRGVAKRCSPWRRLLSLFRTPSATEASIAVVKAALLDLEMSISIYFEQNQLERDEAIASLGTALQALSEGNLVSELNALPTNFAALERGYSDTLHSVRRMILAVTESTVGIRTGSNEIAQASEDLARRTESNAASLEETSAALVQIDNRLKATAVSSARTVASADQAIATVDGGRATADEAVQAMGRVSDSAKGIDSVIEGLDKIAFQTRVLAMNAAVEAGRAGDAGRGFAVVADLVSALAMRAEEEAKRARDQLTLTQTDIVTAVQAVQKVDGALANISSDVGEVHSLLGKMADDATVQSSAITQISAAISAMDQSTQQNAAMVEETSAAARNLTTEVGSLAAQAAMFNTGATAAAGRPAALAQSPRKGSKTFASVRAPAASSLPVMAANADAWNAF
ncbi:methyl-accepting chemotaxis protein [Novosphingobium sp. Rr 2-17]|uniref:globin-coupled sensor protein n=1 Tax=Novosphingobium sp. Rr 2-17 TaxID=555793 RepID=UPI0002699208|nr:globin-coupled sensor protein [Novosphingobium sp. Rr 2-17]EIZ78690.1 methyl-accepting chemotaxis protein [Novosphingobium sp. Rr 2-17]